MARCAPRRWLRRHGLLGLLELPANTAVMAYRVPSSRARKEPFQLGCAHYGRRWFNPRSAKGYKNRNFRSYLIDRQPFFRLTYGFEGRGIPGIVRIRVHWEGVPCTGAASPLTPSILGSYTARKSEK